MQATGYAPGSSAQVIFHSDPVVLATVTANASGAVSAQVTIPTNAATGQHNIEVAGTAPNGAARTQSVAFTVTNALVRTGSSNAPLALFGGLALVLGALAAYVARPLPLKHGIRR